MTETAKHTPTLPDRIRVGQDSDGFWTCREAVSGSPEYVRVSAFEAQERLIETLIDQGGSCASLLEVLASDAQERDDTATWAMASVMAENTRTALAQARKG